MKAILTCALALALIATGALAQTAQPLRPIAGVALDSGTKTAAATAGAATLNKLAGIVTSDSLTAAAGSDYVLTITNSQIAAADQVMVSVANGTNSTEGLAVNRVQPGAGSVVIRIRNTHASAALNGTIKVSFVTIKN